MAQMLLLSERLEHGMRLREARTGRPVSFADCARAAGVTPAAVSNWKKNENVISPNCARPLADFLGVDPLWLETGAGYPDRQRNAEASRVNERELADQISTLMAHFFAATPFGRDQLLDFAAHGIEKSGGA